MVVRYAAPNNLGRKAGVGPRAPPPGQRPARFNHEPPVDASMDRGAALLCYVPIPGLAWLAARARPDDRLVRFHARQGGWLVAATWALLLALGFLGARSPALRWAAGLVLAAAVAGLAIGLTGAARGRFTRLRGVSDILVLVSR